VNIGTPSWGGGGGPPPPRARRPAPPRALSVLYAIESAQPAISQTKLAGLVEHYGFDADDPAAEYFRLHAERDIEHAREAREALAEAPPALTAELVTVAERALEANWRLLDGVERAA
jgi:pyrroloquinoline quinone (PQQ) biosynthesis protein C